MTGNRKSRNEEVADHLHSAAIHLLRSVRRVDDETGLSAPRLSVLSVLVFAGPRTLGELAAAEQVKPPTMTKLVNALEEDGYVARKSDRSDGRITIITATKKGERIMWLARGRRIENLAKRLASLAENELLRLDRAAALISRVSATETTEGRST
ncbi:MAG: MarR family transcriptional regulator [Gemmatimonadales bacterium]